MTDDTTYLYDVFVSCSKAAEDRAWVDTSLVPLLEQAALRVFMLDRNEDAGMPTIMAIEQAVAQSRHTIAVLTPAWLASEWNAFEDMLVRTMDPAARRRKLIPVLLKQCDLPQHIAALQTIDLTVERNRQRQSVRLINSLRDKTPVPPPWTQPGGWDTPALWRGWLWRYRRNIRRGLFGLIGVWVLAAMIFGWTPFQPRAGWHRLDLNVSGTRAIARIGDVLLVSTTTDFSGCSTDTGLWRSANRGAKWQPIGVPLALDAATEGCPKLASIRSFAYSPTAPGRIYAATSDAGLFRSDEQAPTGERWLAVDSDSLPRRLRSVAVMPDDPDLIFVAADPNHLYRSRNGGVDWEPIDGASTCAAPTDDAQALPAGIRIDAMLTAAGAIYVGTDGAMTASSEAGLYRSADGGNCWRRIHDGVGRYAYTGLAALPNAQDHLLVLVYDSQGQAGQNNQLWHLTQDGTERRLLWQAGRTTTELFIDQRAPDTWYVVNDFGRVFRGSLADQTSADGQSGTSLGGITACLMGCLPALVSDFDSTVPLLLANDHIYRHDRVPWYRSIWP